MAEPIVKPEEEQESEEGDKPAGEMTAEEAAAKSRKEKRKERKKMKRKKVRKEKAEKEREEEEAKEKDPEEQRKLKEMEEEEKQRMERERKEFEEREKNFLEEIERKRKLLEQKQQEEEEERRRKKEVLDENNEGTEVNDDDDDWEYVEEEGPAEIIWQGNEIIVRKKKVKVPKKKQNGEELSRNEDDRPTSNPLPPQSEAFVEYQNAASIEQLLENVAQQVPNFGTEQDKAHCPFHLKTGACRFGQRCSRVHFYPDKANTLLMKNMYNGPGLACEQDEGLECTDEEVERCYEEFYEDVHTEFLKYGEIVNFKVCKNSSFHLRGNVYVHYKSLESALLAYQSFNGRYFAGKQVNCEFVNVTRWKVAICGEYMKSRLKVCSRGTACNFIHCFRNPGGDYEWADWDKPPPRFWIRKMTALFGYSDESGYEKQMEQEKKEHLRMLSKTIPADTNRHHPSRSRSRDINYLVPYCGTSSDNEDDDQEDTYRHSYTDDDRQWLHDDKSYEKDSHCSERRSQDSISDGGWSDGDNEVDRERIRHGRKRSEYHDKVSKCSTHRSIVKRKDRNYEEDTSEWSDGGRNERKKHAHDEGSRHRIKRVSLDDNGDRKNEYQSDREKQQSSTRRTSRHQSTVRSSYDLGHVKESYRDEDKDGHDHPKRKSSRHRSISSQSPYDHQDDRHRAHDGDSNDVLDKNRGRHQTHKRRHSRQSKEEISDDEAILAKRLKEKSYREDTKIENTHLKGKPLDSHLRRSHSSRKSVETNNLGRDSRYKSVEDEGLDRWKPESPD